jgi:hypothetical protein
MKEIAAARPASGTQLEKHRYEDCEKTSLHVHHSLFVIRHSSLVNQPDLPVLSVDWHSRSTGRFGVPKNSTSSLKSDGD